MRDVGSAVQRRFCRNEAGFTLVEVGLVVVIIGVLCGIAIPVFLTHQRKAQASAAESDLRSAATAMEAYFVSNEETYGSLAEVVAAGESPRLSKGTTVVLTRHSDSAFCLAAIRSVPVPVTEAELLASAQGWFDSAGGGIQPRDTAGCPVTSGFDVGWQADVLVVP